MRIGIDARTLLSSQSGYRRLTRLLEALTANTQEDQMIFFAPPDVRPSGWNFPDSVQWEDPQRRLRMLHRRGVRFLGTLKFRDLDVFHFPTADVWYSKYAPTVVTLHDLAPLHFPDKFFQGKSAYQKYQKHLQRIAKNADQVITVSDFSRMDISANLSIPSDRIRMIYQGYESFGKSESNDLDRKAVANLRIPGKYFLYSGGLDFRKNVEGLIQGFAYYRHQLAGDRSLVIVGKRDPSRLGFFPDLGACARKENVKKWVLFPGWVNDEVLGSLYRQADAFVFPSIFEGFGYTPLEAMSAGTPVACSEAASLPEVVGEAALRFDSKNPQQVGEALKRLTEDYSLRKTLIQKGYENLLRFNWNQTAKEHLKVYKEVGKV